ncbi:zinc-binding dehydrogenase [Aeromicrobium chenweiae]|uniref:alcohol dehydrogenase n=1 Tax=Aeromicrobium chenweiae TaxID=2079793 RepID=A0A2S0WP27_9ACTN|nr:zinc-binding dehydrogenase [Aeromicrobium chenweiae]AWB93066.1 dehydrogenase [Aeromicrobium chenweiae]TGN34054.1 dehydrogenase [Aeromicrobium chenweiae]
MSTATAAVWSGEGFRTLQLPLPQLDAGELLIEVELATICGSDLHTVTGRRSTPVPTVLGHEAVGRVVAAGPDAPARVGDRVVWTIGTACGECRRCRRGLTQKCTDVRKYGHERIEDRWALSGSFATHVHLLPGTGVVVVPEDAPAALLAPAGCATATVTGAARRVGLSAEDEVVVVMGCGMLGLTAVAYAVDMGITTVIACDVDASRRRLAAELGASRTCHPDDLSEVVGPDGADVVLELSGQPSAVEGAIGVAGVGGRVALVGSVSPGPAVAIDPESVVRSLTTIIGSHNYTSVDLQEAVSFLVRTKHRDLLAALVSPPMGIDRIDDAIAVARRGGAPRTSLVPRDAGVALDDPLVP